MLNINLENLGNYVVPEETKNGICIDIGSNVGSFLKKYANFFNTIYYFEPIKECYNICQDFSKNYSHIHGYNKAVWNESNKNVDILLHQNNDSGSSAIMSDILNDEWKEKKIIHTVSTISLKDILSNINEEIDYCKCDCETSEYFIFLNQDLSKLKYIGMEIHWQMGKKLHDELLYYILNTHELCHGSINYTNGHNREILLRRKSHE
jgi:FkbM family methyltransferase